MNILYLTYSHAYKVNSIYDYDFSFKAYSKHNIHYLDIAEPISTVSFENYDAIILSWIFWWYADIISLRFWEKLSLFKGPKIAILQDEYTCFIKWRSILRDIGTTAIATVVPEIYWDKVFAPTFKDVPIINILTGYIPHYMMNYFKNYKQLLSRQYKIGYRGRPPVPRLGSLNLEKYEIGLKMKDICRQRNISANIEVDEDKRIYGEKWPQFIRNCRVMLGTESGANVFDFDGSIQKAIDAYTSAHPEAGFDEIHAHCIGDADGLIKMNQISPKMFETIALGTGLLLFEGEYSGILKPWRHYIPLKKDYSNLDDALEAVDDLGLLEKMIRTSYDDIVASGKYSYKSFIKRFDDFIESLPCERHGKQEIPDSPEIWKDVPPPPAKRDFSLLQEREMARVQKAAGALMGEKLLFYGAGDAFDLYAPFFREHNEVVGIFLDECFRRDAPDYIKGCKVYSEADLEDLRGIVSKVVIFCRINYRWHMTKRAQELFPDEHGHEVAILYKDYTSNK